MSELLLIGCLITFTIHCLNRTAGGCCLLTRTVMLLKVGQSESVLDTYYQLSTSFHKFMYGYRVPTTCCNQWKIQMAAFFI